ASYHSADPAPTRRPGSRRGERGMTLIEITIALMIVGLITFVAVPSIEAVTGIKARETAQKISGAVRYMYGHSALTGKVCRIVFDMDERAYWSECTDDRFTVSREKEMSRRGQRLEEKEEKPREAKNEAEAMKLKIQKKAEFSAFTDQEMKRQELPDGANLSVWTAHQREKYSKGKAFLYFFPQGNTERALIYIESGHDDVYTLQVSPLNGKVKVANRALEIPRD
ncbi:MAG: Tfp pilus assembly protein FimT/FimU, partial [Myxococcales bacterium]